MNLLHLNLLNIKRILISVLLSVGIAGSAIAAAFGQDNTGAAVQTTADWPVPFSEKVSSHLDSVKAVPAFLRGGVDFTDSSRAKLEALEPNNFWFKIPTWLAGKWEYYQSKTLSYKDLTTGNTNQIPQESHNDVTVIWGWQTDRHGDIWEFEDSPCAIISHSPQSTVYYVRHKNQPVRLSSTKLTCKMFYTYSAINAEKHVVTKTYQSDDLVSFSRNGPNGIRRDVSAKIFNEDGEPIAISTSYSLAKRVAVFSPVNARAGKDIRPLFRSYLIEHGMQLLTPD